MNIEILKADINDAEELLDLQFNSFHPYIIKYGDFESNPCHMELDRIRFNINYFLGKYYKIVVDNKIIGGIFVFKLDDDTMKIAQFYISDEYRGQGIGSYTLDYVIKDNKEITKWMADTIATEDYNVKFYVNRGFSILDFDEEGDSLKFVIFMKKIK